MLRAGGLVRLTRYHVRCMQWGESASDQLDPLIGVLLARHEWMRDPDDDDRPDRCDEHPVLPTEEYPNA